jgi:hypothetical protein
LRVLLVLVAVLGLTTAEKPQPASLPGNPVAAGRIVATWYYLGAVDRLWNQLHPSVVTRWPNEQALRAERRRVMSVIGEEKSLVEEHAERNSAGVWYVRTARFARAPVPWRIRICLDSVGLLHDLIVEQAPVEAGPSRFTEYEAKTHLRLPVDGIWFVAGGGRGPKDGLHGGDKDQRFAYDLEVRDKATDHSGRGNQLTDYFCWGKPVLAPGAGTVLEAEDGMADHAPGQFMPATSGNRVVIDHGNGEQSVLANLMHGSAAVKRGAHVEAGTPVGKCGNSSSLPFPHVHYHLQNDAAEGLPAPFDKFMADGLDVDHGELERGQFVMQSK